MKRRTKIVIIVIGALLLAILVLVANIMRSNSVVQELEVDIRYGRTPVLVDSQVVRDTVLRAMPQLRQTMVKSIDCRRVASVASHVSYLTDVTASTTVSGRVLVKAKQRRPIARIFYGTREMYLDEEKALFPISSLGECNVLIMNGEFIEPLRLDSLNWQMTELWKLACFLDDEEDYGTLVDQAYIERDGDIILVPKLGDFVIELGSADDLAEKFENLWTFFRKGMPRAGWDTYSRISVKFKGQVVCKKKNDK